MEHFPLQLSTLYKIMLLEIAAENGCDSDTISGDFDTSFINTKAQLEVLAAILGNI